MGKEKIDHLRKQYLRSHLNREDLKDDALEQFKEWWDVAIEENVLEANAMILSTVVNDKPSSRTVLLKEITKKGLIFYTNYESQKAKEIAENNHVSLCFLWKSLERQVRVEGQAIKISRDASEKYFQSRPRGSQISAWTSPQSNIVSNRDVLNEWKDRIEIKFTGVEKLPVPEFWGGYEIVIGKIEFWQGRADRLHDRMVYAKSSLGWQIDRLAP